MTDMPYLMIATPCKDGTVDLNYALSLTATCQVLTHAGIKYQMAHVCTSSIDNARNILATLFVKSECTHLLFVDDDMAWASDLPLRMLNENVDIVGVPYRKKKAEPEFTISHSREVASIEGRPWMMLADGLGMGMTLIARRVFDALVDEVPSYHCYSSELNRPQSMFFRHQLVSDKDGMMKYESEDFHFCRLAKAKGFEIFGYIDENVPHIGRKAFSGAYSDYIGAGTAHGFSSERERLFANVAGVES
jgi:hypothetical protein